MTTAPRTPRTLARRLARAERRTELLEELLVATRRDSETLVRDLAATNAALAATQQLMPNPLVVVDGANEITHVNPATCALLGYPEWSLIGARATAIWPTFRAGDGGGGDVEWRHADGTQIPVHVSLAYQPPSVWGERTICVALDLRERQRAEVARRHASKLESLGQLAAGIAHEINTPMQYIGDSLHVLERGFLSTRSVLDRLTQVYAAARAGEVPLDLLDSVEEVMSDTRWRYFAGRHPRALDGARDGVRRVSEIVGAMKRFAHPGNDERKDVDLNRKLTTALVVARPEIKRVANAVVELGALPLVPGYAADLNQVFLNLLVNAAHAIEDAHRDGPGTVTVRTRLVPDGSAVEVAIADTGCGIPEAIRDRVYDPFFTTKDPGRGTGQGLALAHAVIVERHGGTIRFDTGPSGTTFFITLPTGAP